MLSFRIISQKGNSIKAHLQGGHRQSIPARPYIRKRASLFFFRRKGSFTLEAALILPLFFLAMTTVLSMARVFYTEQLLIGPLHSTGREFAQYAYLYDLAGKTETAGSMVKSSLGQLGTALLTQAAAKEKVTALVGRERLEESGIAGGVGGLSFGWSKLSDEDHMVDLIISYRMRLPFQVIPLPDIPVVQRCRVHEWVGFSPKSQEEQTVYVTENGRVYHLQLSCSHIRLSIRQVPALQAPALRNKGGGKYYPCESCGSRWTPAVYITDDGNRYHSTLSCGGLKRTIRAVSLSEVKDLPPCKRCTGGV